MVKKWLTKIKEGKCFQFETNRHKSAYPTVLRQKNRSEEENDPKEEKNEMNGQWSEEEEDGGKERCQQTSSLIANLGQASIVAG